MKKTYRDDFFQEIFDKVAKHLLTQNERAVNASGRCKYRINGLKCAAGILISDSDYLPEMEENIALTLKYFPESGYSKEEIALIHQLQLLQKIHLDKLYYYTKQKQRLLIP